MKTRILFGLLLVAYSGSSHANAWDRILSLFSRASTRICDLNLGARARNKSNDVLDFSKLSPQSKAIYDGVRAMGLGGLFTGWNATRTLIDYSVEVGYFRAALMSSLERILYGDGRQLEPNAASRWLDVGSGSGQALRDFQSSLEASSRKLGFPVEVVGIEPNAETSRVQYSISLGGPIAIRGFQVARGARRESANPEITIRIIPKFFEEIPDADLGQFSLVTSIRSGSYYTPEGVFLLNKMLRARAIVSRMIFDVRDKDIVYTRDGQPVPLKDWLLRELKAMGERVETSPSYNESSKGVTFFLISTLSDSPPSGRQLPPLQFRGMDSQGEYREYDELR